MNEQLAKYKKIYIESLNKELKEGTVRNKSYYTDLFLNYLDRNGVSNMSDFDINIVYQFIESLTFASQTKSAIEFILREFFECLFKHGDSFIAGKRIYPVILTNKRNKIPSYYYNHEVKALIDSIDISAPNAVRDKCIILLATQLGLRRSDITSLELKDVSWSNNTIHKTQTKTKQFLTLPLPENLKFLLIDYIKNHRPSTETEYIFICNATNTKFCAAEVYVIVNKYLQKSGIVIGNRKHGSHALRHSLATNLLKDNTPMPVITGILGHKNLNTTRQYLSIDIESLRKLSLEVPLNDENEGII